MDWKEIKWFGEQVGFLYPYDARHDSSDVAYVNIFPDGRARLALKTEPVIGEAILVYNDGAVHGEPMRLWAEDRHARWWEALIQPARPGITYSFALRAADGHIAYFAKTGIDHAVEPYDRWTVNLAAPPFETPEWAHGAVIYQIFPERFANGEPANDPPGAVSWGSPPKWLEYQGGDLQGITQHLDHLHELGADALYLTPIFASPSNHKYDATDYYRVDPELGGDDALRALIAGLHARGMRLILDASFNHCHPGFFAFQDLIRNGARSQYRDWFTVHEFPIQVTFRPHMVRHGPSEEHRQQYLQWVRSLSEAGLPVIEKTDDGPRVETSYEAWYGVVSMPKINLGNPETRAYFLDVTQYWLREFGIDGWRMDVARHVTPDFWPEFRKAAKAANPDCYLLAEIWGDTSPWLQGDMFDATMNYIFRDLSVDYFALGSMPTVDLVDGVTRMLAMYAPQVTAVAHNLISSHDTERFMRLAGEDARRLRLATLFQLTIPGAPGIYYGDEIGMTGGFDPDCRRAFPWDKPESWDGETLEMVRALTRLRKTHAALRHGGWRPLWESGDAFAFVRESPAPGRHDPSERVLVAVNRGEPLPPFTIPATSARPEVLWGAVRVTSDEDTITIHELGAWSGAVIRL